MEVDGPVRTEPEDEPEIHSNEENTENEAMDTSDDKADNENVTASSETAVDDTAESESLGPETGREQRTRAQARGAGGLAVGAGGAC